jgi:hypothetical protein
MTTSGQGGLFYAALGARALGAFAAAGLLAPVRPDRLLRMAAAARRGGVSPATACALGAARHPGCHRQAPAPPAHQRMM